MKFIVLVIALLSVSCQHGLTVESKNSLLTEVRVTGDGPSKVIDKETMAKLAFIEATFLPDDTVSSDTCNLTERRKELPYSQITATSLEFSFNVPQSCDGWLVLTLRGTNGQIILDGQRYIESGEIYGQDTYYVNLILETTELAKKIEIENERAEERALEALLSAK
ncbi:MAG: hypothetical protein HRU19_05690 [Pseudobacteriovorax sp.]|nr:hypothetical protein [Pseudobacteriovorax sp.]